MAKLTMTAAPSTADPTQGSAPNGQSVTLSRTPLSPGPSTSAINSVVFGDGLGSIDSVRREVSDAFADAKTFYNDEPDLVIRMVMGHCARLAEIRGQILKIEVVHRQWKPIRVEVENCLDELRAQYQYASRLLFSRELDWKIESGGRAG